ncbi:MAG: hypothetical protein ACI9S8_000865 [Chlamydiales bacterium]|jgi:hypothetical protein
MTANNTSYTSNSLYCPITHDIMSNPIRLGCGHNFEKEAIAHWFDLGHKDCPCGRREVNPEEITYNEELAIKIHKYVTLHPEIMEGDELQSTDRDLSVVQFALLSTESYAIDVDEDEFFAAHDAFELRPPSSLYVIILSICFIAIFFLFSTRERLNR